MIDPLDISTLRPARRFADMTQKQLAEAVGLSTSTICEMEKGRHDPKLSHWVKIVGAVREGIVNL